MIGWIRHGWKTQNLRREACAHTVNDTVNANGRERIMNGRVNWLVNTCAYAYT